MIRVHSGLAGLAARRTARVLLAPTLMALLTRVWLGAPMEVAVTLWTALALPLAAWTAARVPKHWRERDGDWLQPRPARGAELFVATWCGSAAAIAASCTLVVALLAGDRLVWTEVPLPRRTAHLLVGDDSAQLSVDLPSAAAERRLVLRARAGTLGGLPDAPSTTLHVRLSGARTSEVLSATTTTVFGKRSIELDAPSHGRPLTVDVQRSGPGPAVALDAGALRLFERCSAPAGVAFVAARLAMLLVLWQAVALALGCWLSAPTTTFGLIALWLPVWSADSSRITGARLGSWLAELDLARAAPPPTVTELRDWLALLAAALALATVSWKRRRVVPR